MIRPSPFLDPRGFPRSGMMPIIGGPRDGEECAIYSTAPQHRGGFYAYADQVEWALVWVPDEDDTERP